MHPHSTQAIWWSQDAPREEMWLLRAYIPSLAVGPDHGIWKATWRNEVYIVFLSLSPSHTHTHTHTQKQYSTWGICGTPCMRGSSAKYTHSTIHTHTHSHSLTHWNTVYHTHNTLYHTHTRVHTQHAFLLTNDILSEWLWDDPPVTCCWRGYVPERHWRAKTSKAQPSRSPSWNPKDFLVGWVNPLYMAHKVTKRWHFTSDLYCGFLIWQRSLRLLTQKTVIQHGGSMWVPWEWKHMTLGVVIKPRRRWGWISSVCSLRFSTFLVYKLQLPGFALLVAKLPFKVPDTWGVLVPCNFWELDHSLGTGQPQRHLGGTGKDRLSVQNRSALHPTNIILT